MLEEMPPFPERESSILAILKKKKPGRVPEGGGAGGADGSSTTPSLSSSSTVAKERKSPALGSLANHSASALNSSSQSGDLLGLSSPPANAGAPSPKNTSLVDVLEDVFNSSKSPATNGGGGSSSSSNSNGFGSSFQAVDNLKK